MRGTIEFTMATDQTGKTAAELRFPEHGDLLINRDAVDRYEMKHVNRDGFDGWKLCCYTKRGAFLFSMLKGFHLLHSGALYDHVIYPTPDSILAGIVDLYKVEPKTEDPMAFWN